MHDTIHAETTLSDSLHILDTQAMEPYILAKYSTHDIQTGDPMLKVRKMLGQGVANEPTPSVTSMFRFMTCFRLYLKCQKSSPRKERWTHSCSEFVDDEEGDA